jgi:hypothetical protein
MAPALLLLEQAFSAPPLPNCSPFSLGKERGEKSISPRSSNQMG